MIKEELKQTYFKLLIPFLIILFLIYLVQIVGIIRQGALELNRIISVTLFILGAMFSLAFPIFYRSSFVSKIKDRKSISKEEFIKFEKNLLLIVMTAPYFVIIAVLFNIPGFYFGALILFAIYSIYYYYPSEKRVKFEMKLFRIKE